MAVKKIAMIPARMGSQRLKYKNLKEIDGVPIIAHAIRKCLLTQTFDEVWVNSEHDAFGEIAVKEGAFFHKRPDYLANDIATSEDFVYEFLQTHSCDFLFQVHSIAPLLRKNTIIDFVRKMELSDSDVQLSCINEQIECSFLDGPVNFSYTKKTNSQELRPIQKITWSITGWKRDTYIKGFLNKECATYYGKVSYFDIDKMEGHVIKTEEDFLIARIYWEILKNKL